MSKAKPEAIDLFKDAIKLPSNQELKSQVEALTDAMKISAAQWKQEDGYSLLYELVSHWTGDIRAWILDLLLKNGARNNVDVYYLTRRPYPLTPLTDAALISKDDNLISKLLEHSFHHADILRDALEFPNASELIRDVMDKFKAVKDSVNSVSQQDRPAPILKAARKLDQRSFQCLQNEGEADLTIETVEDNNIVHEIVLGIIEKHRDKSPLDQNDKAFIEMIETLPKFTHMLIKKNSYRQSPMTLACESGLHELILLLIKSQHSLDEYKNSLNKQITHALNIINLTRNMSHDLKTQLRESYDKCSKDIADIILEKSMSSSDELIESVKKLSKIDGYLNELTTLVISINEAKGTTDYQKAYNTFTSNCQDKFYSEEIQTNYQALIGALIAFVITLIIATTLLLVATGGIATFGAATIIAFVTENIAISAAAGAAAAVIICVGANLGYNYGDAATWRANFFGVGSAVNDHIELTEAKERSYDFQ